MYLDEGECSVIIEILEKKLDISFIDIGYSYKKYLKFNDGIVVLLFEVMNKKVVIVGSGVVGIVVVCELFKIGLIFVIIEVDKCIGGCLEFCFYYDGEIELKVFLEMGVMCFLFIGEIWFYYFKQFGVKIDLNFFNLGKIDIKLFYCN